MVLFEDELIIINALPILLIHDENINLLANHKKKSLKYIDMNKNISLASRPHSFLEEVLDGIQPDVIACLQGRLSPPFVDNIQIKTQKCALTLLDHTPHAIVCVGQQERIEEDYFCIPYQKNPDDLFEIGQIMRISPEQVIRLKQR